MICLPIRLPLGSKSLSLEMSSLRSFGSMRLRPIEGMMKRHFKNLQDKLKASEGRVRMVLTDGARCTRIRKLRPAFNLIRRRKIPRRKNCSLFVP